MACSISSVMITRLMLNLRDPKWMTGSDPTTTQALSAIDFAQTRGVATTVTFIDTRHEGMPIDTEWMRQHRTRTGGDPHGYQEPY